MAKAQDRVCINAFGVRVALETGGNGFLEQDSVWRLREIYERFLALQALPDRGMAIDIGAGFGAFAIPFALAHPDWRIICFEPLPASFDVLCANIEAHGISSITPICCAIGGTGPVPEELREALGSMDPARITLAAPKHKFLQNRRLSAFLSSGSHGDQWRKGARSLRLPTIPADVLAGLEPTLVKFVCPGFEDDVMSVVGKSAEHIVGESWEAPAARHAYSSEAATNVFVPLAGTPLRLHRKPDDHGRRDGLDVVVATYNARDWIADCVHGIVGNDDASVRAIVVDDGSTDGSGEIVRERFAGNSRVRVLRKPNGGCASARNFGRINSDAAHVAFVDSDDFMDADFFPTLLELARYSGDPVTQGGFDLVYREDAALRYEPSSEIEDHRHAVRHSFRGIDYFHLDAAALIPGQPAIWRRVYRRDFLDDRNIWFPEHIRAFDDQIFHMLSLQYAGRILCTDAVSYHYRQHPGQDIRQGDERCFHSLEMYRTVLKRAVSDGWNDFAPFVRSFANTINWTAGTVRPDLLTRFLNGAAEIWVLIEKTLGTDTFQTAEMDTIEAPEFPRMVDDIRRRYADLPQNYAWAYMSTIEMFPELVRGSSR